MTLKSSIKDNQRRGTAGSFLNEKILPDSKLSIVSAYFTIYAYNALKEKLDEIESLDFLFGEPSFLKNLNPDLMPKKEFEIEDSTYEICLKNRLNQKSVARDCAEWIRNKVNIKSMVKPNFLHGKMYHIQNPNRDPLSLMGSSNFTYNGLGYGNSKNIELNLEMQDRRDVADLKEWFDEVWNDETGLIENVKEEVLKYIETLYAENSPEFIYYLTLHNIFEGFIDEQEKGGLIDNNVGFFETSVWNKLFNFQKDGVKGVINKIDKYGGCILADSVGLGKTFQALAVIKYYELLNDRVLVLCPKKLRENWTLYVQNDKRNPLIGDKFRYSVLHHTDLSRENGKSGDIDLASIKWGNYDLVVIDESHNFRNNAPGKKDEDGNVIKKSRYKRLMDDIIKDGRNTKVLLLSATPVNNNLKDLRNQIYFITKGKDDALEESAQIRNIGAVLKIGQEEFTKWADPKKNSQRKTSELLEKLDSSFFKLLDTLTIARSRQHIKKYYDIKLIGDFPERLPVISIAPEIDMSDDFPTYKQIDDEISDYKLSLFNPSAFLKKETRDKYLLKTSVKQFSQEDREYFLIGMMKVNFLKRLESSINSFGISLERTINKIDQLLTKIDLYIVNEKNYGEVDIDEIIENEEDEDLIDAISVGKKMKYSLKDIDIENWKKALMEDRDHLEILMNEAKAITVKRDKKLNELKKLIVNKIQNPLNQSNKKILIFTAYSDTASYLYTSLKEWAEKDLKVHIAMVAGGLEENKSTFNPKGFKTQNDFNKILTNFSPISKNRDKMDDMPQNEEIDILIATDCISEGQNLQDCDYLVNYDIHWNPVRIIQRFGRIDRIGSKNKKIQMINFWPTDDLNEYINLKDRVEARMALVDITATTEENILSHNQIMEIEEDDLKYRNKQLEKLKNEVLDLEDLDDNISLSEFSLNDFRIELSNFIDNKYNKEKLKKTPKGLYAVVPSNDGNFSNLANYSSENLKVKDIIKPGVIFCLKQKGDYDKNNKVNPLQPFFLVYIYDDGKVKFNYTSAKQILDMYRLLCDSKREAYEQICNIFNEEIKDGLDMSKYSELLENAVNEIRHVYKKRSLASLTKSRSATIADKTEQVNDFNSFELITWLIVR